MAEPGWYNAAGDPPGTQRYWDGNQWIGDVVYEPSGVPPDPVPGSYGFAATSVVASTFPSGLKAVAIVLSVLKMIPLGFAVFVLIIFASIANDFDDAFDDVGFDGLVGAAVTVVLVIALIGVLLIGFQFVGALKERPMMVFVPALLMSLLDGLFALGAWSAWNDARNSQFLDEGPGGPLLMTTVFAAQAYVAVAAIRANNK